MKKMIYVSIALAAIFLSCKKDDADAVTPATSTNTTTNTTVIVPKGPVTRSDLYPENGYISGTIISKLTNGSAFYKEFRHELDFEIPTFYQNSDGRYVIHLSKADKSGRVGTEDKKTEMTFILEPSNNTAYDLVSSSFSIYVDSSATSITKFEIDQSIASNSIMTISNVDFNPTSGIFKADYAINYNNPGYTSSKKNATVTGKISTTLTNVRYRTGHN